MSQGNATLAPERQGATVTEYLLPAGNAFGWMLTIVVPLLGWHIATSRWSVTRRPVPALVPS
jgi:hypothetical protein